MSKENKEKKKPYQVPAMKKQAAPKKIKLKDNPKAAPYFCLKNKKHFCIGGKVYDAKGAVLTKEKVKALGTLITEEGKKKRDLAKKGITVVTVEKVKTKKK